MAVRAFGSLLAESGGDFWQVAEMMWRSPDYRPVMLVAAGLGVLIGLGAFPIGRRLLLAVRPRGVVRNSGTSA